VRGTLIGTGGKVRLPMRVSKIKFSTTSSSQSGQLHFMQDEMLRSHLKFGNLSHRSQSSVNT